MGQFFDFLSAHRSGILLFMLLVLVAMLVLHWVTWLFARGRFRDAGPTVSRPQGLRIIFTDFLARIINDFRHLLALVIVLIFAAVLSYAMVRAGAALSDMNDAIQTVVASLGGLVGSIIGYYFGESAVVRARESDTANRGTGDGGTGGTGRGAPQAVPRVAPMVEPVPPIEEVPQPPAQ